MPLRESCSQGSAFLRAGMAAKDGAARTIRRDCRADPGVDHREQRAVVLPITGLAAHAAVHEETQEWATRGERSRHLLHVVNVPGVIGSR